MLGKGSQLFYCLLQQYFKHQQYLYLGSWGICSISKQPCTTFCNSYVFHEAKDDNLRAVREKLVQVLANEQGTPIHSPIMSCVRVYGFGVSIFFSRRVLRFRVLQ